MRVPLPPGQIVGIGAVVRGAPTVSTPIIDTLRGLLTGAPDGGTTLAAVAWGASALALAGYPWARVLFRRDLNR